jgi:hypothetical protein
VIVTERVERGSITMVQGSMDLTEKVCVLATLVLGYVSCTRRGRSTEVLSCLPCLLDHSRLPDGEGVRF